MFIASLGYRVPRKFKGPQVVDSTIASFFVEARRADVVGPLFDQADHRSGLEVRTNRAD
jgi:hypothetical protein